MNLPPFTYCQILSEMRHSVCVWRPLEAEYHVKFDEIRRRKKKENLCSSNIIFPKKIHSKDKKPDNCINSNDKMWYTKFRCGSTSTSDAKCSRRSIEVTASEKIEKIDDLVLTGSS